MEIFLPAQTWSLLQVVAPCVTAPSFAYFQSSLWALMVVEGRTWMTRLARCAFCQPRDLSRGERCLAAPRWSLTAGAERLVRLGVARLGEQRTVHGASLVGTDTTVVATTSTRMVGGQKWKDHSDTADRGGSLVGPHWNRVGLISPWGTRGRCWPLGMRWVPGLQGARQWLVGAAVAPRRFWDAAIAALLEGTRCLGDVAVRVVADAYDSKAPLLNGWRARGIDVISRLRTDAGGWDAPAPRPPGKRGRTPRDGRTWTVATLRTAAMPTRDRLPLEGKLTEVGCVVRDVWRRDVAQKGRGVVLEGGKEPVILVSPDLSLAALQSIAISGARCSRALTIRDVKQPVGLGDSPWTTTLAILRLVHVACLALCVGRLALLAHREAGWLQGTSSRVSLPAAPLRFPRVRRALRAWATRQGLFAHAAPGADWEKIARDHEPLLQMLM